jgi:hypothetical protein
LVGPWCNRIVPLNKRITCKADVKNIAALILLGDHLNKLEKAKRIQGRLIEDY